MEEINTMVCESTSVRESQINDDTVTLSEIFKKPKAVFIARNISASNSLTDTVFESEPKQKKFKKMLLQDNMFARFSKSFGSMDDSLELKKQTCNRLRDKHVQVVNFKDIDSVEDSLVLKSRNCNRLMDVREEVVDPTEFSSSKFMTSSLLSFNVSLAEKKCNRLRDKNVQVVNFNDIDSVEDSLVLKSRNCNRLMDVREEVVDPTEFASSKFTTSSLLSFNVSLADKKCNRLRDKNVQVMNLNDADMIEDSLVLKSRNCNRSKDGREEVIDPTEFASSKFTTSSLLSFNVSLAEKQCNRLRDENVQVVNLNDADLIESSLVLKSRNCDKSNDGREEVVDPTEFASSKFTTSPLLSFNVSLAEKKPGLLQTFCTEMKDVNNMEISKTCDSRDKNVSINMHKTNRFDLSEFQPCGETLNGLKEQNSTYGISVPVNLSTFSRSINTAQKETITIDSSVSLVHQLLNAYPENVTVKSPLQKKAEKKVVTANSDSDNDLNLSLKALPKKPQFPQFHQYCNKRFYDFLIEKMKPKYSIKTNSEVVKVAEYIWRTVGEVELMKDPDEYNEKHNEMRMILARKQVVKTHWEFHRFCTNYLTPYFCNRAIPRGKYYFKVSHPGNLFNDILPLNK